MSELRVWYRPTLRLLDARATAQTDVDQAHFDPNNRGDIPSFENSETHTLSGKSHRTFDS
jgi:hypothetical protein